MRPSARGTQRCEARLRLLQGAATLSDTRSCAHATGCKYVTSAGLCRERVRLKSTQTQSGLRIIPPWEDRSPETPCTVRIQALLHYSARIGPDGSGSGLNGSPSAQVPEHHSLLSAPSYVTPVAAGRAFRTHSCFLTHARSDTGNGHLQVGGSCLRAAAGCRRSSSCWGGMGSSGVSPLL